jgi:hypothetical protein
VKAVRGEIEESEGAVPEAFGAWEEWALTVAHETDSMTTRVDALHRNGGSREFDDAPE